ncbi:MULTISPECIES: hypothetical protein, partial [unclassified Enterococcus]|uniref:hypothetical protein n=1 Tax=unclassified Enterococcus TaxID=2608891 RepID=UPI0015568606
MLVTIHDKTMKKIGFASNVNPKAVQIKECKALYNLPTGAHELSISFINNGSLLYQQITDDKFISY